MEPCVSNKTSMISFADPGPGGISAPMTLTSQFGRLRWVSLGVGLSEFVVPYQSPLRSPREVFADRLALP